MRAWSAALVFMLALSVPFAATANSLRERDRAAKIAGSALTVTPDRDWNKLKLSPGKKAETWTLDGEELNDITFYAGIRPGDPLIREVNKKRKPLPKLTRTTLLLEIPDLVEGTYRSARDIATFSLSGVAADKFLGREAIRFNFDYVGDDALPRRGEGVATLIDGLLYMAILDAPRLNYYDRTLPEFRKLTASAKLG